MIYVVDASTEGGDHYYYAFKKKPTREAIIRKVMAAEGYTEDYDWYESTVNVEIKQVTIE